MGLWSWLKSWFVKKQDPPQRPLISLVLLLREQRYLDAKILTDLVNRAWGLELTEGDPDAVEFVAGFSPSFLVQTKDHLFLVNNFPVPYLRDVEAEAGKITDLRLRQAVLDHRAWISVDLMGDATEAELPSVYEQIGKLLAELVDDDCLALFAPATSWMIAYDERLAHRLRGPEVLEAFRSLAKVPVVEISAEDPRMLEAVAEARRRWPEFVAAFETRRDGQKFAVKAPFTEAGHTEFMWMMVTAIEGDLIYGTLENDPVNFKRIRYGSKVSVAKDDLNDWVISDGAEITGGFSIKVFENRLRGNQE